MPPHAIYVVEVPHYVIPELPRIHHIDGETLPTSVRLTAMKDKGAIKIISFQ